jgi:hypothetical protein
MKTISIYDPALCCSTGVCGPEVDPKLVQFAADVKWLQENGVTVTRHNLAQDPAAFVTNGIVKTALTEKGADALPLILVNDRVVASGAYPSGADLAAAAGLPPGFAASSTTTEAESSGCCGGDDDAPSAGGCCGGEGEEKSAGGCCSDGESAAAQGSNRCCS